MGKSVSVNSFMEERVIVVCVSSRGGCSLRAPRDKLKPLSTFTKNLMEFTCHGLAL